MVMRLWGSNYSIFKTKLAKSGSPFPKYSFQDRFLVLTWLSKLSATSLSSEAMLSFDGVPVNSTIFSN